MRVLLVLFSVFLAAQAKLSYKDLLTQEWLLFKAEKGKSYESQEDAMRMEIYLQNKYEVAQHNLKYRNGEITYEMEINKFSDWLPEELAMLNGFNKDLRDRADAGEDVEFPEFDGEVFEASNITANNSVNWVEKGAVSPVKDQKFCGSCYAFSAIGALESQQYIKAKKMIRLSEQQILDCSTKYGNRGCNGGLQSQSYEYINGNGGVNPESSYPYEGKVGKCRFNNESIAATCNGYVKVSPTEEALKNAVSSIGPIAVSIHVTDKFHHYKSGVFSDPECKNRYEYLNHAVLLVGYDTDPETNQEYWLVKNSWGTGWGERGYIRMAKNKNNMCGIATSALYPTI